MIGMMMDNVDLDFDFEVTQLNKFLAVLMDDSVARPMAVMYKMILEEEYANTIKAANKVVALDGEPSYIDEDIIDTFTEVLDEVKAFIAESVIWQ